MPNWSDPVELQKDFSAAIALVWISVGISAYDFARYAAFDWSIITGKRARRWPQIPYFAIKIIWWAYIVVNIIVTYTYTEINCQLSIQMVELCMGLLCIGSSILLAARAICVWHGVARTVVAVVLGILCAGLTASWMISVPYDVTAIWVPGGGNPWTDGACAFTNVSMSYSTKYAVTIVFDAVVLIVTIAGVLRMRSSSRIGNLLISQGILYFVVTFIANAIVFGLTVAKLNPVMSLIGAVPSSCVAMIASTQLYAELAEQGRPLNNSDAYKNRRASGTGNGSAEKSGSFFSSRIRPPTLKYTQSPPPAGSASDLEKGYTSSSGSPASNNNGAVMMHQGSGDTGSTLNGSTPGFPGITRSESGSSYLVTKSPNDKASRMLGEDVGGVSVHREVTVEATPLPEHLVGTHFLSQDQLASIQGATDARDLAVQTTFAGLSKNHQQTTDENDEPVSPSSASNHRKSESSASRKPAPKA